MNTRINAKFTDEQLMEALKEHMKIKDIATKFSCAKSSVERRIIKLRRQGFDHKSVGYNSKVPDGFKLKGRSIMKDARGNMILQWEKSTIDEQRQLEMIKEMCISFTQEIPKVLPETLYEEFRINENLMAVYPLGDPHIGMLAWADESGENWDLKIAEQVFCEIFDRVVKTAPDCDTAVILNLGDYFDNMEGTTSRSGNRLDVDGRYAKMVRVGVKIIRQMITTCLQKHRTCKIINVKGNHDDIGAIFLTIALKHIYENEPRVEIDESPSAFHYVKFGKVLLGAHHGHTCKMDKLPGVMAADKSEDWGQTKFRYWMTGHIHHDSKQEHPGCMVESFRTLAAKDAYASFGGWRAGQDTKCIVFHKDFGEVERHTINIAQMGKTE
jgi:hypothetical protein